MSNINILLVNPNNRIPTEFSGIEPPIWAGMIATDLRAKKLNVAILDAEAENLTLEQTAEKAHNIGANSIIIVVMGANPSASSTPKMPMAYKLKELLGDKVQFTGLHPQAAPEPAWTKDFTLWRFRLWENLPNVAWDLLPMNLYRAHNWHCLDGSPRQPYGVIYTSLGCPYSCSYCNIHALYDGQHKIWYRKPEDVIKEIDLLVNKYKVRNIKIWDEMFVYNQKHVITICDLIIERGYNLNMWAYARVDTVNKRMLRKMKQAGINWLGYGIESASEHVRQDVSKKFEQAKIRQAIDMTHDAGIHVHGNFIFGLPEDDMGTMRETLDFAKELNLEYINFYVAMPYPGSQLYKDAIANNLPLPKTWESYSQFSKKTQPLATKYLTPQDIVSFRDKAFMEYFTNPQYLQMLKEKFGKQAVDHIESMLAQKIRR